MKLKIIVGTVNDNALYVAQSVQAALAQQAQAIELIHANSSTLGEVLEGAADEVVLICTSTHGNGELPENIQPLYVDLDAQPRYLGSLRYGLIAMGDTYYGETFAGGGRLMDARLQDLGAQRLGDAFTIDATEVLDPEPVGAAWAVQWWQEHVATIA